MFLSMESSAQLFIVAIVVGCFDVSVAQSAGGVPDVTAYITNSLATTSFWTSTISAVSSITNSFLNTLSGSGIFSSVLKTGYNVDLNNASFTDLQNINWTSPVVSVNTFVLTVLNTNWVYVFFLALGIAVIIYMSMSCCCFSCFRNLGCCCGKTAKKTKKPSDKIFIGILYAVVIGITALIFLAAFASLVSGTVMIDSLTKSDNTTTIPFVGGFLGPALGLIAYVETVKNEINRNLDVNELVGKINDSLKGLNVEIKNGLSEACTDCRLLTEDLTKLQNSFSLLKDNLTYMSNLSVFLTDQYGKFNSSLETIRQNAKGNLSRCADTDCQKALGAYNSWTFSRDPTILPDLGKYSTDFNDASSSISLESSFNFNDQFNEILDQAYTFQNLKDSIANFSLNSYLGPYMKFLNTSSTEPLFLTITWNDIKSYLDIAAIVVKTLVAGVAFTLLPVVLLNIVALILGPACKGKKDGTSEKVFVASSRVSYSVSVPLSPVVYILFLVGSVLYGEVCRDINKGASSTYFGLADRSVQSLVGPSINSSIRSVSFFKDIPVNINITNLNILRTGIYKYCMNRESLFNILFDTVIFDNETINATVSNLLKPFESKFNDFNLSSLPIFGSDFTKNFDDAIVAFKKLPEFNTSLPDLPVTLPTLDEMIISTNQAAAKTTVESDKNALNDIATKDLPNLKKDQATITNEEINYRNAYQNITELASGTSSTSLPVIIEKLKSDITKVKAGSAPDSTKLIERLRNYLIDEMIKFFYFVKAKLLNLVHCRPLYDLLNILFTNSCSNVVNPLNAFWFSIASAIILFIPGVLMGLWLGGLLTRQGNKTPDANDAEQPVEKEIEKPAAPPETAPAAEEPLNPTLPLPPPPSETPPLPVVAPLPVEAAPVSPAPAALVAPPPATVPTFAAPVAAAIPAFPPIRPAAPPNFPFNIYAPNNPYLQPYPGRPAFPPLNNFLPYGARPFGLNGRLQFPPVGYPNIPTGAMNRRFNNPRGAGNPRGARNPRQRGRRYAPNNFFRRPNGNNNYRRF